MSDDFNSLYNLYESGQYKPLSTVLGQQRSNPLNQPSGVKLPDLSSIPTNQIQPLNATQANLLETQQRAVAERLVRGASPQQLQQIAQKGGVYSQAAAAEMARGGMVPKISTTATSSAPASATTTSSAPASASASPTATGRPVAGSPLGSGLAGIAAGYAGEKIGRQVAGETGSIFGEAIAAGTVVGLVTGNPVAGLAAGGITAGGSLALRGADALGNAAVDALGLREGEYYRKLAIASQARLDRARANASRARPSTDLGENFGSAPIAAADTIWTASISWQREGQTFYVGFGGDNGGGSTSPPNLSQISFALEQMAGQPSSISVVSANPATGLLRVRIGTSTGQSYERQFMYSPIAGASPPTAVSIHQTLKISGGVDVRPEQYKPTTETRPDPNYFPYLPTVKISGLGSDFSPPPLAFADPEEPQTLKFAPSPSPQPSPPSSPLAGSSPAFANPPVSAPSSTAISSNSGVIPAYVSPAFVSPAFVAKPFVAGVSNPADQGKEIDAATGLERSEWEKRFGNNAGKVSNSPDPNSTIKPSANQPDLSRPLNPPAQQPSTPQQNTPPQPNNQTGQILAAIAALTGTVVGGSALLNYIRGLNEKIDAQTTAAAQQTNAKQGVCDAMQPQQCGYEGVKQATTEATQPIKDTATANNGLLQTLLGLLQALNTFLLSNIGKILDLLNRQVVDRVLAITTFAMTLHNALMLSQGIGDTVGAIVDNILNLTGLSFKNSEGTTVGAGEVIGANFRQFMINIVGEENYTALSTTFAQANRIYQAGMNIVNNVQSMLDSAASVAQSTGINVAKIGNALRDNHVVSPREYGHMDDSAIGNRPTKLSRWQQLTTTISDADSNLQNFASITGSVVSIKDSVKQSKDDIKAFNDARDANSQANKDAKEAIEQQIKELKPLTEITIAKREEDN